LAALGGKMTIDYSPMALVGSPMGLKSLFWQHSVVKWQSITLRWHW